MPLTRSDCPVWTLHLGLILSMLCLVSAYRPVQHCKHLNENGHYSACAALAQTNNTKTGHMDLYLRYHWYRYRDSNRGWHAFAMGDRMAGAHMLIMYGDPTSPNGNMTVSVRTADGHHPPRPISEFSRFEPYFVPEVEVVTAHFEKYDGPFIHQELQLKPSHVGKMEVIVRSWGLWPGQAINDGSNRQPMIWSSNYKQDYSGDFSGDRTIEMHQYGLGFGFLYTDMANAVTSEPMFGPIDELAGLKGASEIDAPPAPTKEELDAGERYIASIREAQQSGAMAETTAVTAAQTFEPSSTVNSEEKNTDANDSPKNGNTNTPDQEGSPIQQPARTIAGKTIRDWMWHLHGLLMCLAFLVLYPLGVYLLRRPPVSSGGGSGFNFHWTIQSLSTVSVGIGAIIGWFNSRGISVSHQYIGLFLVALIPVQIVLGWRHHVIYMATKRRTLFSKVHVWTGRLFLPLGYINIVLGMLLRQYRWLTMVLVVAFVILESAFLVFALRTARNSRIDGTNRNQAGPTTDAEEEEYLQLSDVDDDDDEWSDDEGNSNRQELQGSAAQRQEEKRRQAERLSKLDKV